MIKFQRGDRVSWAYCTQPECPACRRGGIISEVRLSYSGAVPTPVYIVDWDRRGGYLEPYTAESLRPFAGAILFETPTVEGILNASS